MNWQALAEALDITTETRPVYRAGKRAFLTKDAAIRDAIKGIARSQTLTVELLLALRRELLATGASALGHWDQLQSRLTIASRTSADLSSWFSTMCRQLNLPAVSSVSSKARDAADLGVWWSPSSSARAGRTSTSR